MRNRLLHVFSIVGVLLFCPIVCFAADGSAEPALYATAFSVIPPLVAIVLALITKEVYSSLFIGIVIGGFLYSAGHPVAALNHIIQDGIIGSLADSYNVGILFFLVVLGVVVALMNRTGGSAAFGEWAATHIKTPVGAQFATIILGVLIFVDDYFNCLTVGSVMSPIMERHHIPKTKFAYLIDSTAAPICIIAPVSSWAAAVTGFVEGQNGFTLFIKAIPFNFYAILTLVMMFAIVGMRFDYGKMRAYSERIQANVNADNNDSSDAANASESSTPVVTGKVVDLVFPILVLIASCIIAMIYTGGFFSGAGIIEAFSGADASVALALGSIVSLVIILIYYLIRRVISFTDAMGCIPDGFKAMVSPILILTLAWTLKSMTDSLGIAEFVASVTSAFADSLMSLLPAIIFLIGCLLAFASGTSWGTFGILIPIVVAVFQSTDPQMMIISISACMAGAVCGDHCSPISDTTIMASAGSGCNHVDHVSTQLPYALTVASVSFVTYIIAGFTQSALISLPCGIILILLVLTFIRRRSNAHSAQAA